MVKKFVNHSTVKLNWIVALAAVGFSMKATWMKAITAVDYAKWPGITKEAVQQHFLESKEMTKEHARKMKAGLHIKGEVE